MYEYFLSFLFKITEKQFSNFFSIFFWKFSCNENNDFFKIFIIHINNQYNTKYFYGTQKNKYLSTKYNEVNLRNGHSLNQLVLYKILIKGYPVEVTEVYENWYKVTDHKKGGIGSKLNFLRLTMEF